MILDAFESHFPVSVLVLCILETLHANIGHRICFEMLAKIIEHGDQFGNVAMDNIIKCLGVGLAASSSGTRKAAVECCTSVCKAYPEFLSIVMQLVSDSGNSGMRNWVNA